MTQFKMWVTPKIYTALAIGLLVVVCIWLRSQPRPSQTKLLATSFNREARVEATSLQLGKNHPYEVGELLFFDTYVNDLIDQKLSYIIKVGMFLLALVMAAVIGVAVVSLRGQQRVRFPASKMKLRLLELYACF